MALDSKLAVSSMKRPTSSMALLLVWRPRASFSGRSSGKHWATPFCSTIRASSARCVFSAFRSALKAVWWCPAFRATRALCSQHSPTSSLLTGLRRRHEAGYVESPVQSHTDDVNTSPSLLSQAEQGAAEGQDRLLGPEGVLGHLQSVRPMRRQLQLLVESLGVLLLGRQQQLAEPHAPGVGLALYGPVVAGGGVPQQADALVLQDLLAERRFLPPQGVDPPHAVGLVHGGVQSLEEIRRC
ncbi:hypothetical protein EYF80_011543 [Liparis tanakae]|uniref:Uncharacterized protein n=1 Tax=Liparis tanakae TaxID=230148 RepID=A0A4Z2IMC6_9TELE|nr:hypothetical protein EYF80_011543 [Liparis tanakae]